MIDFAALPPEINSARMYSGPGSAPMLTAAAAWNTMAAEMQTAAAAYDAVLVGLASESWLGTSSMSMVAAVAPYLDWLSATAVEAEQAGSQANAAASAYEAAFTMTVPPATIATNRAQLANLLAANIFGQNTAAIAANEAQYSEMWAQDAAAMNGYASASSAATQFAPLTSPQSPSAADGPARQANAVTQAASTPAGTAQSAVSSPFSNVTSQLAEVIAPGSNQDKTGLAGILNDISGSNGALLGGSLSNGSVGNFTNAFTTSGLTNPTAMIDSATAFGLAPEASPLGGASDSAAVAAAPAAAAAGMGRANLVGALSVPPAWSGSEAPLNPALATTRIGAGAYQSLSGTEMVMDDVGPVGIPGMPLGGAADADDEFGAPIYGFRPRVLGRPPAAG